MLLQDNLSVNKKQKKRFYFPVEAKKTNREVFLSVLGPSGA